MRLALACLAVVVMLSGCAKGGDPSSPGGQPSSSAVVAERVDLRAGESRTFGGNLMVRFEQVTEESRCPMDAMCVRMGEAVAQVRLSLPSTETALRELRTGAPESASRIAFGRYAVELIALTPYPRSDRVIDLTAYTATIEVKSR